MSDNTGDDSLHVPSLRIEGFRGIDSLTINRLGRVTLLAGRNGTGKTTVLDAVRQRTAFESSSDHESDVQRLGAFQLGSQPDAHLLRGQQHREIQVIEAHAVFNARNSRKIPPSHSG